MRQNREFCLCLMTEEQERYRYITHIINYTSSVTDGHAKWIYKSERIIKSISKTDMYSALLLNASVFRCKGEVFFFFLRKCRVAKFYTGDTTNPCDDFSKKSRDLSEKKRA